MNTVIMALLATLFTWFVTALGAGTVAFFKTPSEKFMNLMLGFSAGVMIAASFWSLLQPAIEQAEKASGLPAAVVVTAGFLFGAVFMRFCDILVSWGYKKKEKSESVKDRKSRIMMLILAITIHNIPEGLAIGVAFGAINKSNYSLQSIMAAATIALGIGIQNFPEGAAVSIPLRREGHSRWKSFLYGQASGIVEPISGVLGALLVSFTASILPLALSFAAGAMILVAVHELIPESQQNRQFHPYFATFGAIGGFAVMMLLDVMLG